MFDSQSDDDDDDDDDGEAMGGREGGRGTKSLEMLLANKFIYSTGLLIDLRNLKRLLQILR